MKYDRFTAREEGIPLAELDVVHDRFPEIVDPVSGMDDSAILSVITNIKPGTVAFDHKFMPGISDLATRAEITEIPDHAKTREASNHYVLFGQLLLASEDEAEGSLYLAVKTLDDSLLAHEYNATRYVADGNIPLCDTFGPFGVARMPDGQAAMLSLYRHPVRSMDNIFANLALIDEDAVVNKALGRAGMTLATPHAADWVHRDPQTKNVVWDIARRDMNLAFLNDLEVAESIGHYDEQDRDNLKREDIRMYIASTYELEAAGYEMPSDYDERIKGIFGSAYTARLNRLGASDHTSINRSTINDIVDSAPRLSLDENGHPIVADTK